MKKKSLIIIILLVIVLIVASILVKIFAKNKNDIPFEISAIEVVGSISGEDKGKTEQNWNLNIIQNNDFYIRIGNNKDIEKIVINNFIVDESPKKGNVHIYKPSNDNENKVFENSEEYKVENELIFTGDEISGITNSNLLNYENIISFRCSNEYLVNFESNDNTVTYNGSLLKKLGITQEDIQFTILFDILIETKTRENFKTTVMLDLPTGNIVQEEVSTYQINKNELVFKKY